MHYSCHWKAMIEHREEGFSLKHLYSLCDLKRNQRSPAYMSANLDKFGLHYRYRFSNYANKPNALTAMLSCYNKYPNNSCYSSEIIILIQLSSLVFQPLTPIHSCPGLDSDVFRPIWMISASCRTHSITDLDFRWERNWIMPGYLFITLTNNSIIQEYT